MDYADSLCLPEVCGSKIAGERMAMVFPGVGRMSQKRYPPNEKHTADRLHIHLTTRSNNAR
ncbi:MAG: hypothetical protein U0932_04320 [Thiobacillus sp.]|nr:hypothetical protein [Thiobacillus sp.]